MSRIAKYDRSLLEIAQGVAKKRTTGRTVRQIAESGGSLSEHVEQKFLIERLFAMRGKYPELALLYAVPNGGLRHKATAGKMKAEGVTANVPDLVLPVPRWPFHGLYVEMKARHRYGGQEQRKFQRSLLVQAYAVFECRGEEAAYSVVMSYLALDKWSDHGFHHNDERARMLRRLAGLRSDVTTTLKPTEGTATP